MGTPHTPQLPTLLVEESGDTVAVRPHRPGKSNAVNRQMLTDLIALCDWLEEREDVHFVVLTNEGKVFAAGQDLVGLHTELSDEGRGGATCARCQLGRSEEDATAEELSELGVVQHVRLAEEVLFLRGGADRPAAGRWTTARCR